MQPARAIPFDDTLRLAEGVRLTCDWEADLHSLLTPDGAIPLNHTAAALLALCNGTSTRSELIARFARDDLANARHIGAFIDAAERRGWIAACTIPVTISQTVHRSGIAP